MKLTREQIKAIKDEISDREYKLRQKLRSEMEFELESSGTLEKVRELGNCIIQSKANLVELLRNIKEKYKVHIHTDPYINEARDVENVVESCKTAEVQAKLPPLIDFNKLERDLVLASIDPEGFDVGNFISNWLHRYEQE